MKFIIRFMQNDKFMLVCNADRTPMTFTSKEAATEMAWRFEEKYKDIHWAALHPPLGASRVHASAHGE